MTHTTDPSDPRLGRGSNDEPVPQNEAYLIDKGKGKFVRPVRRTYVHWTRADGSPVPVVVESAEVKKLRGCGAATTMSLEIAETYARDPKFYGSTYCVGCQRHRPVSEFTWDGAEELVGS